MRHWKLASMVGLFAVISLFGEQGLLNLIRIRKKEVHLRAQNRTLALKNQELADEIQKLKDRSTLERLIRSELGFARDNEEIYEFGKFP